MGELLTTLDLVIFFAALIFAMAVGVIAGRKEETSQDYFLAGKRIPWWGVAGSIYGSNVSANHMVGMMGIGFSVGFAQSHFELGAIAGLMVLCYGFLPVYRKLNVYTLSEYLGRRYDDRSRVAYAVIMVIIMAVVQMVPALYIGSRSICLLLGGDAVESVGAAGGTDPGDATESEGNTKLNVDRAYYAAFVIALAAISASYTIFGGLKAVIWTDVIQSVLLLAAAIAVAILTFHAIGGWSAMMALDRAGEQKMHLYLPMNHAELPWTGVLTGLMAMHFFYWGTNQFIVQRALAAKSDTEARLGIIAAGFLKLLIPFFAIAAGIAAFYLFKTRIPGRTIDPDTAFTEAVKLVVPIGYGIIGLISAGLIGAILSSIDSMMNSAATIVTVDIYQRYIHPHASQRRMILIGRLSIVAFVVLAALMAILVLNPNSDKNFFLQIVDYQTYLTPGLLVAFIMGMLWRRGTATAALVTILSGVLFSCVQVGYDRYVGERPKVYRAMTGRLDVGELKDGDLPKELRRATRQQIASYVEQRKQELSRPLPLFGSRMQIMAYLGPRLNFFHRVVVVILLCTVVYVAVSLFSACDPQKSRLVWTDLGGHAPNTLRNLAAAVAATIAFCAALGYAMHAQWLHPTVCAVIGAGWTLAMFFGAIAVAPGNRDLTTRARFKGWLAEDRFWAGILCSLAIFMMYYFY